MADRIISWFFENEERDGTAMGATYCLDQSYVLPAKVRMSARQAPVTFSVCGQSCLKHLLSKKPMGAGYKCPQ